jgi:hypothetical protein
MVSAGMTVIEIRPYRNGWKVFEAPGIETFEIAGVLVSLDHVAKLVINANHSGV